MEGHGWDKTRILTNPETKLLLASYLDLTQILRFGLTTVPHFCCLFRLLDTLRVARFVWPLSPAEELCHQAYIYPSFFLLQTLVSGRVVDAHR